MTLPFCLGLNLILISDSDSDSDSDSQLVGLMNSHYRKSASIARLNPSFYLGRLDPSTGTLSSTKVIVGVVERWR